MKIKAENLQFLKNFDKVKVNDPYSVGSVVQVVAEGKNAVFTIVTDDVFMRSNVELEGESNFQASYPIKEFYSYVNTLAKSSIIEFDEKGIKLSGKSSRYNLKSKDIEIYDFDSYLPEEDQYTDIKVPASEIKMLSVVRPFIGEDKFAAVSIYRHDNGFFASAGNPSIGAITYKTDIESSVSLPSKFIDVIKESEKDLIVKSFDSNYFFTELNGIEIYYIAESSVQFPDMNLEQYTIQPAGRIVVDAEELQNTLKRMSLVTQEENNYRVFMYADEGELGIYVIDKGVSYDFVETEDVIDEPTGSHFSLNVNNLNKFISILDGEIDISFSENPDDLILIRNNEVPDMVMRLPPIMDYGNFDIEEIKSELE